mmetsp:Transcript_10170/g.21758  ORF Transcript_10170/g.21758 Transcript_10170/m.21758 type:complete len:1030 (+) Transcript_10170:109-3198(+)
MSDNGDQDSDRQSTDSDYDDDWEAASIFNPPRTSIKQKSSGQTTTMMATPLKTTETKLVKGHFHPNSDGTVKQGRSVSSPESSLKFSMEKGSKMKRKKLKLDHTGEMIKYNYLMESERSDYIPNNCVEKRDSIATVEEQDALSIKFSLSHLDDDYIAEGKGDASITEYLISSSPEGPLEDAKSFPRSDSFQDSIGLFPSPFQMSGDENFDFPEVGINDVVNNDVRLPKLSTPPATPQRKSAATDEDALAASLQASTQHLNENYDFEGTKLDQPPPINRIVKATKESPSSVWMPWSKSVSTPPRPPADDNFEQDMHISPYKIYFDQKSGPNQHRSPGRTIYNVPSKSPSRIGQQHDNTPSDRGNLKTSPSLNELNRKRHKSNADHQDSLTMPIAPTSQRSTDKTPKAYTTGDTKGEPRSEIEFAAKYEKTPRRKTITSDLIVTPFPSELPPAVSNESTSPLMMHRARANNMRSPPGLNPSYSTPSHYSASGSSNGSSTYAKSSHSHDPNWPDSLHMAPLPPFVPRQIGGEPPPLWTRHGQATPRSDTFGHPPSMHLGPSWNHSGRRHSYYKSCYHPHMPPPQQYGRNYSLHTPQVHSPLPHHENNKFLPEVVTSGNSNLSESIHWRQKYHQLSLFKNQFGHCNVPYGYGAGTSWERLHSWVVEQRYQYERMTRGETSTTTSARASMLSSLGFSWDCSPEREHSNASNEGHSSGHSNTNNKSNSSWGKWISLLQEYKTEFGNVDVPLKYERNPSLGTFVNRQRTEYRKMQAGKPTSMTAVRVRDLNRLGFTWAVRESHTSWEDRFQELKQFKMQNGHCNVPKIYPQNPSLGYWVNEQRFQYRRLLKKKPSYMTDDKIRVLNSLDFKWSLRESNGSWETWMKELKHYKAEHGNVDVPLKYAPNQALGAFVNRQRTEYRKMQQGLQSRLTEERIQDLDNLGFKWAIRVSRTPWERRLKELKEFKAEYGHCNVPSTYPKNQPLAYWVFKQRGQYRIFIKGGSSKDTNQSSHMTPDRIRALDEIGFEWNPPRRTK